MTKVILFDFWGTLVENGIWSPIQQIQHILRLSLPFSEYVMRLEKSMMTKPFNSLKEAFQEVCQEFEIEPSEAIMEQLIGLWNKNWMLAKPYEETMEMLNLLKEKYTLVLIANTDSGSIEKVLEKYKMASLFHKIYLSYKLNKIKTDKDFFKTVLEDLKVKVEDCVIIGDSIQSDIMPAKKVGMKAILIDRKNGRDFDPKIINLKRLEEVMETTKW